jgi:SpoVK/Ycf46/Vps4 family AAA+-type ATPase
MIMATSNLSQCIDVAFLSRADLKQYVGPPSERARYVILKECIDELIDKGMIQPAYDLLDVQSYFDLEQSVAASFENTEMLFRAVKATNGLCGRILRRLPFLAFVYRHLQAPAALPEFLGALHYAIEQQTTEAGKE